MLPRDWIILGIFISIVMVSTGWWLSEWSEYGGVETGDEDLGSTYNYIENLSSVTDSMKGHLGTEKKISTLGLLDFVIQGGYNVLLSVLSIPVLFVALMEDMGSQMGIPRVFVDAALVLMAVALIFGIVGVIFRRKT